MKSEQNTNHSFADQWLNLADERLDTRVLECSDDFFAEKENIIKIKEAVFDPDAYTERGKLMDGWESRRKRVAGFDYIIIKLGAAGQIKGIDIDTSHFTGNYPEQCSLEAALEQENGELQFTEIIAKTSLKADSHNLIDVKNQQTFSHVKLNIYPDGGVARLRVYGEPAFQPSLFSSKLINLSAIEYGAQAVLSSNEHFGDKRNILFPKKSVNMGDGWETKRRRGMKWELGSFDEKFAQSGYDWVAIKLACRGIIQFFDIDTHFFKGNFPYACSIDAVLLKQGESINDKTAWIKIVSECYLNADRQHIISIDQQFNENEFSHIRLNIYPDGGIARFKALGVPKG